MGQSQESRKCSARLLSTCRLANCRPRHWPVLRWLPGAATRPAHQRPPSAAHSTLANWLANCLKVDSAGHLGGQPLAAIWRHVLLPAGPIQSPRGRLCFESVVELAVHRETRRVNYQLMMMPVIGVVAGVLVVARFNWRKRIPRRLGRARLAGRRLSGPPPARRERSRASGTQVRSSQLAPAPAS